MDKILGSIRKEIKTCVDAGEKKFIIAPFGYWGKETKKILNEEFGIQEEFCVDNSNFDEKYVFSVEQMPETDTEHIVLIATANEYFRYQFIDIFCKYVPKEKIKVCVSYNECENKVFSDTSKVKLDFLCVGFAKCGTMSLQTALIKHPYIYLPEIKETFFIKKMNGESHQRFQDNYPAEHTKNKLVGGIEPTYFLNAESVYNYFGSDLKIIMCVANPIKALYSRFIMAMRDAGDEELKYFEKFGKVTPELFDEWMNDKLDSYCYINYIKFYLKFFKKSQIKVIVSERLFYSPEDTMDELQSFIGIRDSEKVIYSEFPHTNKGSRVSKSYAAACINKKIWELITETRDLDVELQIRKMRHEIFAITTEQYTEPMFETTYQRLFQYYEKSIHELEDFLDMTLKGVWYE